MVSSSSVAFLHLHYTTVNNYTLCKTEKGVKGITFYLPFTVSQQNASIKFMPTACSKSHLSPSKNFKHFSNNQFPLPSLKTKKNTHPILGFSQAKQPPKKFPKVKDKSTEETPMFPTDLIPNPLPKPLCHTHTL